MKYQTSGGLPGGRPVWANIPEASRTHGLSIEAIDRFNPNREAFEARTGHRDLRPSTGDQSYERECFWCGWRFDEFSDPADFLCVSEREEEPAAADAALDPYYVAALDPYYIEMRERHLSQSILDGLPERWIPKSTPPSRIAGDLAAGQVTRAEAAFFALHSGIPASDLTSEAAQSAREMIARGTAAANVLRYVMWLIGTEIHPTTARLEQATVNALFRIRDEFGLQSPTEAGVLLDPDAVSPATKIAEAHARGTVIRFTLGDLHLYPGFQFKGEEPYGVIAVLRETATRYSVSENNLVLWMIRATTRLTGPEGNRPVDLLPTRPDLIPTLAEKTFGVRW